jgi:ribA/ribD-fused uncharacterized protein
MIISEFKNEYRFLSNFWLCEVEYAGKLFPSVEHAYVFAKTNILEEQELLLNEGMSLTPAQIKGVGRSLTLRPDWNDVRIDIMRGLVKKKFSTNSTLKQKLLDTGKAELIEGNTWHDYFWGVCNEKGQNWLGKILMDIREDFKKELENESIS